MAKQLEEIGVDVPFLSILTPFKGTPSYAKMMANERLRSALGWEFYNGYNVTFIPNQMTPDELLHAHRDLWHSAFRLRAVLGRIGRSLFRLRRGGHDDVHPHEYILWAEGAYSQRTEQLRGNKPLSTEHRVVAKLSYAEESMQLGFWLKWPFLPRIVAIVLP